MQPKTAVVEDKLETILAQINKLLVNGYKRIEVHFYGSRIHEKYKIRNDYVLIRAFRR
ncbi:MAG: hypothetical protein ACTSQA_03545 [Candidatus Heimdallarchaeaceae archaeon]